MATTPQTATRGDDLPGQIAMRIRPVADALDVDLVDVEVRGARGSRVVRLIADADDGLDIDRIAALSRDVGDAVDDLVDGSYTLEVTSPGADRPLRRPKDFARNTGRDVRIQRTPEAAQQAGGEVTGRIVDVTDEHVVLNVKGKQTTVPHADIDHGKVVLPW